ncbi:MAG TPA: MAPEG family protein [Polyangiales bacterium]|nr:MAPEG family protein [Polyangiales bacterium]
MTAVPSERPRVAIGDYVWVGAALTAFCVGLAVAIQTASGPAPAADGVIGPMAALVSLTALVWLAMVLVRNLTILHGTTDVRYYKDYASHTPLEWVERPARLFNNLFQAPMLFYVVCLAMLATQRIDAAQLRLAWIYVAARLVHAVIYVGWNYVPYRFAAWIASCIALGVLWFRFV